MFLLIISLFCQNAALAIPILALTSCSHLAFSVIQLPRYLYCSTCCNITLSRVTRHCAFPSLQTTITLFFLHLLPFHKPCTSHSIYLSSSAVSSLCLPLILHHLHISNSLCCYH